MSKMSLIPVTPWHGTASKKAIIGAGDAINLCYKSGMITIKRAYASPAKSDGHRVLIDRLWPRGVARADAAIDEWLTVLAPSAELRRWFGHDPQRWREFSRRYRAELAASVAQAQIKRLRAMAKKGTVTLVFAARDEQHCNAVVLRTLIAGASAG